MNTDCYYEIGHSHIFCEDYALAGIVNNIGYAIVSDGCSSSDNVDVGARVLAHIAKVFLRNLCLCNADVYRPAVRRIEINHPRASAPQCRRAAHRIEGRKRKGPPRRTGSLTCESRGAVRRIRCRTEVASLGTTWRLDHIPWSLGHRAVVRDGSNDGARVR